MMISIPRVSEELRDCRSRLYPATLVILDKRGVSDDLTTNSAHVEIEDRKT